MGGDGEREAAGRLTAFVECWDQLIGTKWLTNDVEDTWLPAVALADLRAVLAENARMQAMLTTWPDSICGTTFGQDAMPVFICTLRPGHVPDGRHENAGATATRMPNGHWLLERGGHVAPQQPAPDAATAPRDWWRTRGACRHCGCDVHQDDPAATVGDGEPHVRCQQRVQEHEAEGAARRDGGVG